MSSKENGTKSSTPIILQNYRKIGVMDSTEITHQGPDAVLPTNKTMTWDRSEAVMLRMSDKGQAAEKPISVMSALKRTAERVPTRAALSWKEDGKTKQMTYKEYYSNVKKAAKAFIKLGVQPEHGVGIIGFNSPEWFIADVASIFAGGFATGIYTTNSADACFYILDDAQCDVVVVENDAQLKKILEIKDKLPNLKAIVQYRDKPPQGVYSWDEFLKLGTDDLDKELEERIKAQAPNKCCTLVYTSGTTGNSKGVMLSHDNMIWTVESVCKMAKIQFGHEEVVSYLPLSHAAAQMLDLMMPLCLGATVHFAQPDALKGSLGETLREVRPTVFLGVPRVWEKMQEAMVSVGKKSGPVKKWVASWAKDIGLKTNMAKMNGQSKSICYSLANQIVFKKVRLALGFDRCHFFLSGAAPITRATVEFFLSLNIAISEVYGMSESSGPHTVCLPWENRITSVGKEFPGAKTRLVDPDKDGNGEVCMAGRHVFMGYLNMEDKTREALDEDGWLHSGDVGRKDKDGFLFITGRIKELIITAGGENIPPVLIEDKVKEVLPCVSNCMLIGDKRKFLALLITLKTEVDKDTTEPLDQLSEPALDWCKQVGSSAKTVADVVQKKDEAALKAIEAGIQKVNKLATSRAQCVQKWSIVPRDFSIPGGELGPTLKLKRPVVAKMYEETIEEFYLGGE